MNFFYKALTWAGVVAAPFYAAGAVLRRPGEGATVAQRLGFPQPEVVRRARNGVWLQAASVGEWQIADAVSRAWSARRPELRLSISVTTATARALMTASPPPSGAGFTFPADLPPVVGRVVRLLRPRLFVAVETELWPNLYAACHARGVPVALVNGRISDRALRRYLRVRNLMARTLSHVSLVCARSEQDARHFKQLGLPAERIRLTGDLKLDRPGRDPGPLPAELLPAFLGRRVLVAGSTHAGEEQAALDAGCAAARQGVQATVVLAPRHLERLPEVQRLLDKSGLPWSLRTRLSAASSLSGELVVVVLDTMGELEALYPHGHVALLGGTLAEVGGHNPLEAAAAGVPLVAGPHLNNVSEMAAGLQQAGGMLFCEKDATAVCRQLTRLLVDGEESRRRGGQARDYVKSSGGALDRTLAALDHLLTATSGMAR